MNLSITAAKSIRGRLRAPSDKSLTHRSYLFAAIASGVSRVRAPLMGEDCESTLRCLGAMGFRWERSGEDELLLHPASDWIQPNQALDCGNSGTTMRLLSGLLASRDLDVTLVGDASLSRRPMARIAEPLRLMGARVEGETPPLRVTGTSGLKGIRYESSVASAQVKSCVLLAGLRAQGETIVSEPSLSRDHTERMLHAMGAAVVRRGGAFDPQEASRPTAVQTGYEVGIHATDRLEPFSFRVPADISSAAFFMVAAALLPGSKIFLEELSVNPTRTGILEVFEQCGIPLQLGNEADELGEPVADVEITYSSSLKPFRIGGSLVPRLIDEIPVLCVLATQCEGTSEIRGARELRVKESDRIEVMAAGLRSMGAKVETFEDGLAVTGPTRLRGVTVEARGDHRIGMAFAVAGLVAEGSTVIEGAESIATSFPRFEQELERLTIR